jgi:hypothetical protein
VNLPLKLIRNLLILGAFVILGGFIFVGYVAYERATGTGYFGNPQRLAAAAKPAAPEEPLPALRPVPLPAAELPPGIRVEAMQVVAGRVVLLARSPAGPDRLLVFDPVQGAFTAVVPVGGETPSAGK